MTAQTYVETNAAALDNYVYSTCGSQRVHGGWCSVIGMLFCFLHHGGHGLRHLEHWAQLKNSASIDPTCISNVHRVGLQNHTPAPPVPSLAILGGIFALLDLSHERCIHFFDVGSCLGRGLKVRAAPIFCTRIGVVEVYLAMLG